MAESMSNETRAMRIGALVHNYALNHDPGEEVPEVVTDMIADLLHYLNERDTYRGIVARAVQHYEVEAQIWEIA